MLPDQPTYVLAVRARFAPEAWSVSRVFERQLAAVEDLGPVKVGERNFRRRDEIEIPLAGNLEEIGLELGQITGPEKRCAVDEERRLDLAIAVFAGVQVEHEIDQRS